jgi:hypothetical protein
LQQKDHCRIAGNADCWQYGNAFRASFPLIRLYIASNPARRIAKLLAIWQLGNEAT